ncbi:MAG: deoxyribodipyrimidine photo-lyase, partial [Aquificaceae bacterium]|nr:deoxyribodipyrimidine photo-lyase [Aquificaceae bacterium]
MRAVFLFKRDLRLKDNRALSFAAKNFSEVVPVFIFDDEILSSLKVGPKRLSYIVEALEILSQKIKLYCLKGDTLSALRRVFETSLPKAFVESLPLTWSGRERSEKIVSLCKEFGISYHAIKDNVLSPAFDISPRQVFTPFYKEWIKRVDSSMEDESIPKVPDLNLPLLQNIKPELKVENLHSFSPKDCNKRMLSFNYGSYSESRSSPAIDGTSKLSPCIRFGIISLRELFLLSSDKSEQFVKELAWREFWYHVAWHFPHSRKLEL